MAEAPSPGTPSRGISGPGATAYQTGPVPSSWGNLGLKLPLQDWEAALILYGVGLYAVQLESIGEIYVIGAWSVAAIMVLGLPGFLSKQSS